ncbi:MULTISPECIES: hypothetical protein [Burkholderiaceae]|uniref:hypothetical protein n=1 Tax=Burkholderiaceae TaxID=119060 RepID=UPI000CFD7CB9|nr:MULTISPECIES: hypothetical protein [Burkholderiaceae]MBJ9659097.1 hypothetical protein [Burkholderia gladioli]PQV53399.1 hypothetical protein B0G83_102485 [Paraburkholderia sp. BL21I4N1]
MLEIIGVVLGIVIADYLRPIARLRFAIRILTAVSTVVVVACLPIQGLIVSLIVALGLRLAWAQLINSMTERGRS